MGIVADRFDDSIRGRMFALMNMSRGLGGTLFGALYSITSEWCPSGGRWESCALPVENDCTVDTPPCICENGFFGWEYSFIVTGVVVMAFAPVIYLVMNPPPGGAGLFRRPAMVRVAIPRVLLRNRRPDQGGGHHHHDDHRLRWHLRGWILWLVE